MSLSSPTSVGPLSLTPRFPVFLGALLCLALGGLSGCDRAAPDNSQESSPSKAENALTGVVDRSLAGAPLPDFVFKDAAGQMLDMGALQGQPVLLNLWATWCAPCIKEMPLLDDVAGDYGDALKVLTISQDIQGAARVEPFFAEQNFEHLEAWLDPKATLTQTISSQLPTTVLYDANGEEVWRVVGDFDWSSVAARGAIDEGIVANTHGISTR